MPKLNGISLDGTMKINGISLSVVETNSVTNWSDLPSTADAGTVYLITATGQYYEYHATAGWVPSVISQKTFASAIDAIDGDAIPNTLGDWTDTASGGGSIAIDSGAVKYDSSGGNSHIAKSVGTHSLSGADWYCRCDIKCTDFSGTTHYSAAMVYCYDGAREVRVTLRHAASSGRVELTGGGSATDAKGVVFSTIELDDFKTLEIIKLSNTCYFFFDGVFALASEHEEFRSNGANAFYIADSSSHASAITYVKNFTLWKLT